MIKSKLRGNVTIEKSRASYFVIRIDELIQTKLDHHFVLAFYLWTNKTHLNLFSAVEPSLRSTGRVDFEMTEFQNLTQKAEDSKSKPYICSFVRKHTNDYGILCLIQHYTKVVHKLCLKLKLLTIWCATLTHTKKRVDSDHGRLQCNLSNKNQVFLFLF